MKNVFTKNVKFFFRENGFPNKVDKRAIHRRQKKKSLLLFLEGSRKNLNTFQLRQIDIETNFLPNDAKT